MMENSENIEGKVFCSWEFGQTIHKDVKKVWLSNTHGNEGQASISKPIEIIEVRYEKNQSSWLIVCKRACC